MIMVIVLQIFMSVAVSASPTSLPANVSLSGNLINITNPPSFSTTTQKGVVFCGYGKSGTTLYFYEYNSGTNSYKPILSNGEEVSVTVNNSGVFWKKINFDAGYHKVVVFAESGKTTQTVKREINVISPAIADKIRGFTLNINDLVRR